MKCSSSDNVVVTVQVMPFSNALMMKAEICKLVG